MSRPATTIALFAVLALGAIAVGCGDDDDDNGGDRSDNQTIIDAMISEGATQEQAECMSDELGDDLRRLYGSNEDELSEEDMEKFLDALEECGAFDEG